MTKKTLVCNMKKDKLTDFYDNSLSKVKHRTELNELLANKDINEKNTAGKTYLHLAAQSGDLNLIRLLLSYQGIQLNPVDNQQRTPLFMAAYVRRPDVVEELLNHEETNVNHTHQSGETLLMRFAYLGDWRIFNLLLNHRDIDVNRVNHDGDTAIFYSIWSGRYNAVELLLRQKNINVNCVNRQGQTPLYNAIFEQSVLIVEALLSAGALLHNDAGIPPLSLLEGDSPEINNPALLELLRACDHQALPSERSECFSRLAVRAQRVVLVRLVRNEIYYEEAKVRWLSLSTERRAHVMNDIALYFSDLSARSQFSVLCGFMHLKLLCSDEFAVLLSRVTTRKNKMLLLSTCRSNLSDSMQHALLGAYHFSQVSKRCLGLSFFRSGYGYNITQQLISRVNRRVVSPSKKHQGQRLDDSLFFNKLPSECLIRITDLLFFPSGEYPARALAFLSIFLPLKNILKLRCNKKNKLPATLEVEVPSAEASGSVPLPLSHEAAGSKGPSCSSPGIH
jgi:ankyrin repeat protein